jgi:hypothetical protein
MASNVPRRAASCASVVHGSTISDLSFFSTRSSKDTSITRHGESVADRCTTCIASSKTRAQICMDSIWSLQAAESIVRSSNATWRPSNPVKRRTCTGVMPGQVKSACSSSTSSASTTWSSSPSSSSSSSSSSERSENASSSSSLSIQGYRSSLALAAGGLVLGAAAGRAAAAAAAGRAGGTAALEGSGARQKSMASSGSEGKWMNESKSSSSDPSSENTNRLVSSWNKSGSA